MILTSKKRFHQTILISLILATYAFAQDIQPIDHYIDRYSPVAIFNLDQQPQNMTPFTDTQAVYKAAIHKGGTGLPKQIKGARFFTGQGWDFKGVDASLQVLADDAFKTLGNTDTTTGIAVSFWMKIPVSDIKSNHRLFGHNAIEATMSNIGYGGPNIRFGNDMNISLPRDAAYKAYDGNWHHIAASVDFHSKENNMAIFLDGKEILRKDGVPNKAFNDTSKMARFYIGARRNGGNSFTGALDDVAVFNHPLSPSDIEGIFTGPLYAGKDKEVYLPNYLELEGAGLKGRKTFWRKRSGPGEVQFQNPTKLNSTVKFSEAGTYVLELQSEGVKKLQTVTITAHPPRGPFLSAGSSIQSEGTHEVVKINATAHLPGNKDNKEGISYSWQKLSGPGNAIINDVNILNPEIQFDQEGLYQLELTATANSLSTKDVVSVMVGKGNDKHYVQLLNPLYLLPLDTPSNNDSGGVIEVAKKTTAQISNYEDTLPQLAKGARSFTGQSWDFTGSSSLISVHNRFNISRLTNPDYSKGLSVSFWIKADGKRKDLGRIGGMNGVSFQPSKGFLNIEINGAHVQANTPLDNTWQHIALTADYKSSSNNIQLYINGILESQTSHVFGKGNFGTERTDHFHRWGSRSNSASYLFNGLLDDIAVFDYPLNQSQIHYIAQGPTTENLNLLGLDKPSINAGKDIILDLPLMDVSLSASTNGYSDISYKWRLLRGPGEVTIHNPKSEKTTITFHGPSKEHLNPNYQNYIFEVTAKTNTGELVLTDTDEVSVVFHKPYAPKTRKLFSPPAAGEHPRIYFSKEDIPSLQSRTQNDPVAQKAIQDLQAQLNADLYSTTTNAGIVYHQLKDGKNDVNVKKVTNDNTRGWWQGKGNIYAQLSTAALISLIENDNHKLEELGTVLSRTAKEHLKFYRPNYPNKLIHDADGGVGLAYDWLYNHMTDEQRNPVRTLLSKMTKWRQSFGSATTEHLKNSTNWKSHHDQIIIAGLAIEGEEGYDDVLISQGTNKLRSFLTQYGVFNSGYAHEGYTYYLMGMEGAAMSALALSNREENLYETTNIYNSVKNMFRCMPPQSPWITGHGDASAEINNTAPLIWILRYLWPNDPISQYISNSFLDSQMDKVGNKSNSSLLSLLFAITPSTRTSQEDAAASQELPDTQLCPDKGYMNARNHWGDDAVNLVFRSRQDKYQLGHMHPDVNSFELYANGTTWFWDGGKYNSANDFHQTILINGRGGGGSSDAFVWPNLPGRIVEFENNKEMAIACGDAKAFYDFVPNNGSKKLSMNNFKAVPVEKTDLLWADFMYGRTRADLENLPSWRAKPMIVDHGSKTERYIYNPVEKAYRTAVLIKSPKPYVLIVDDYKKDDQPHLYEWIGNMEHGTVEAITTSGKNDLLLKKTRHDDKGNRLLVRVIEANGQVGKPQLRFTRVDNLNKPEKDNASQVHIACKNTVEPKFKILLYPHKKGDPLPETNYSANQLTVSFEDQKDIFQFQDNKNARTKITKTK